MGPGSSSAGQCVVSFADGVGANSPVNAGRLTTTCYQRLRIRERYRRIGMVGLSTNPFRRSDFATIYLLSESYEVIPVNPREAEVLGRKAYPSVSAIPGG